MMNKPMILALAKCRVNGITLEVCQGEIPDVFRLLRFDPITELELPDTKASDVEFKAWIGLYRHSSILFGQALLGESQCN